MSPRIISHRGKIDLGSSENNLKAIQQAIELGIDMVEFDIRKTSDDVLVCYHDAKVNGILVSDVSFNFLKDFNKEICRLEEVITLCKGKTGVNLEIKEEGFETRVVDMLTTNFSYEETFVTSFLPSVIRKVKILDHKITTGLLLGDAMNFKTFYRVIKEAISMEEYHHSKADFISPYYKIYEIGLMRNFQKLGIPIQLWTVNDLDFLKDLINSNIHSIVTDVSDKLFKELKN